MYSRIIGYSIFNMFHFLTTVLFAILIGIMCIFIAKIQDLEKDFETKLESMKSSLGTSVLDISKRQAHQEGKWSHSIMPLLELVSQCRRFSNLVKVLFLSAARLFHTTVASPASKIGHIWYIRQTLRSKSLSNFDMTKSGVTDGKG